MVSQPHGQPAIAQKNLAMVVDLRLALRRPLEKLLHDCPFSEWENIALFLDGGSTEALRWAGGLDFVLEELGISQVIDLQAFGPERSGAASTLVSDHVTRGIFLVATFVWDIEGAVLNAARSYGLTEVTVACSVSEEAHACHPYAAHISEETGGRVSFSAVSQQLKVSLERMLKIQAQSSGSSRRRFAERPSSPPPPFPSSSFSSSSMQAPAEDSLYAPSAAIDHPPIEHLGDPSPTVSVTIVHSPHHLGCFFQPPITETATTGRSSSSSSSSPTVHSNGEQQGCSAFSLASPACARVFPLRRCDWEGRGGGGAGAALFAAAAAVEGGGGGDGGTGGRVSAEEVPREERLQYRLLAQTLVEALWDQLLLDVSGGGGVFTLGDTSRLIGSTVATAAEDVKRVAHDKMSSLGFGGGRDNGGDGGGTSAGLAGTRHAGTRRREASVVLIDRNLDLAAAASHGGSLLQRILSSIARTGAKPSARSPPASSSAEAVPADGWSSVSEAHQQDVGVVLPMLAPGLGLPSSLAERGRYLGDGSGDSSGDGVARVGGEKPPRLLAMKALANFSWPAPPSLCHSWKNTDAARVVHAMASLGEVEGQAALIAALEKCVSEHGCTPPPRKRRGMGSSIMALVTSLSRGNPRPGGLSGEQACFRCRGVVQVALAAMEAHQRTSSLAGSSWQETVVAERAQLQQLRDGGTSIDVMEQLCATLNQAPPPVRSTSAGPDTGTVRVASSTRDALLLALRGVSLAGEGIGTEDASSFRKAWVSRMLTGGVQEAGSGVPSGVAEAVDRIGSRCASIGRLGATSEGVEETSAEGAGVLLELEDIARERTQRLREAAASRSLHLKNTPFLRDLGIRPYTFVASSVSATAAPGGGGHSDGDMDVGGGGEDEWDDWEDDEAGEGTPDECVPVEHTTECDTLVGRLAGMLLDRTRPDVPDLHEAKLVSATSVGLSMLSSGWKKLGRIGGATGGGRRGHSNSSSRSRPTDRPVVVIFVVGGFTPLELAEVNGVVRCASAAAATAALGSTAEGSSSLDTEVILAGTTVSTPDVIYEQIFARPPAGSG